MSATEKRKTVLCALNDYIHCMTDTIVGRSPNKAARGWFGIQSGHRGQRILIKGQNARRC